MWNWLAIVITVLAPIAHAAQQPALWLYCPTNLLPPKNVDQLEQLWKRAAAAGYTHVLLADSKFSRLGEMPREYFRNCDRVKQIARDLKIEILPAEFDVGYSNDVLSQDPNLAEGLPVKDTLFVVQGGEAHCVADPPVSLDKISWKDEVVQVEGSTATIHDHPENARLVFKLKLPPFRCYHVSVQVRTEGYTGHPEIHPIGGQVTLNYQNIRVERTQDWKTYDIVFDSLNNTDVNLYLGVWGGAKGTLQWRDWKIEEVGLVNVLRRAGTPCVVRGENEKLYVEGKDYEHIEDPHMGNVPWKGEYQSWHEPPTIKTKLADGTKLRVSWYYPPIIYDGQVAGCISDPKFMELLADQSKRMKQLWGTPGYMMSHDEFRCCNWDESCEKRHETPGKMLAENLRQCTRLVKPQQAYVWSDMFDPFHNAVKGPYFLVNGPWAGSWEGLEPDVIVLNWNYGKRDESLRFFADRGNRQIIAGYYDGPLSNWQNWLQSATKVRGVVGYMYTTWVHNYDKLEEFAKMSRGG